MSRGLVLRGKPGMVLTNGKGRVCLAYKCLDVQRVGQRWVCTYIRTWS